VSEAEVLVAGGVADVLVTNEIVGKQKIARLARLTRDDQERWAQVVREAGIKPD